MYQWRIPHCQEYGFIVSHPKDKEDVTEFICQLWQFHYLDVETATYIMQHGLCLEEFLALYKRA